MLKAKLKDIGNSTYVQLESFRTHPPKFGETKVFASDLVPGNAVLSKYISVNNYDLRLVVSHIIAIYSIVIIV